MREHFRLYKRNTLIDKVISNLRALQILKKKCTIILEGDLRNDKYILRVNNVEYEVTGKEFDILQESL